MTTNQISITGSLTAAFESMKGMLFRPFALEKWLVLGFTAGLAGAGAGGNFGSSWSLPGDLDSRDDGEMIVEEVAGAAGEVLEDLAERSGGEEALAWLTEHPIWLAVGLFGCGLTIALVLVILWLNARGKFMFLDNVVHDRAEVVRPWKRYRRVANSYFFFQLALIGGAIFVFLLIGALFVLGFGTLGDRPAAPIACAAAALGALVIVVLAIALSYLVYFLNGFVVPLMYRYDLTVMPAWSRFGELLRRHPWPLILSGPFLLVIALAVQAVLIAIGLMTCCIGLLLLALPYVGTVLILPVPVTYRAFTVALLDQIDPGYFPRPADAAAAGQRAT